MARERMTQRLSADKALVAIDAFEQTVVAALGGEVEASEVPVDTGVVAGADEELEKWTNGIAKEERAVAQKSTGISTDDEGDQNNKSMDNWPTNASEELSGEERTALATELTALSKGMAQRIASGGLKKEDREFVATRLLAAAKRIATPTK